MGQQAIFFKLHEKDVWHLSHLGPNAAVSFDISNFRLENPDGNALLIDLDKAAGAGAPSLLKDGESPISNENGRVIMTTVHLEDGRHVDVFPATGDVQVFTKDRKQAFGFKIPLVEGVAAYSEARRAQTGSGGYTIGAYVI